MENTKKINNIWSILCQKAIIDSRSQLISIIDVIETISIVIDKNNNKSNKKELTDKQTDTLLFSTNLTLVSYWQIDKTIKNRKFDIQIDIKSPDKKTLSKMIMNDIETNKEKDFHRTLIEIKDLPIEKSGIYYFIVSVKQNDKFYKVAKLPLLVNIS